VPRPVSPRGVDHEFPRLGLATCPAGPEPSVASLAMLAGLTQWRWRVQHFRTRACPTATEAVGQVTGLPGRHLDAWLMPEPVCRGLFARAAASAELSLVEGTLEAEIADRLFPSCDHPGDLRPIAEALNLPVVAVVSCRGSDAEPFHLPRFPEGVDAVLLDELADPERLPQLKRLVQLTAGLPVVGAVEAMPGVRAALEQMPRDRHLPDELIDVLGRGFLKYADLSAIDDLARCRPFPCVTEESGLSGRFRRRFRVAYAQDEAFGRYFPDTIEALEALGADLVEFSPLRDEALPERVNLVMIGCGFPDHHADELASNHSMIAALGEHVCLGRRIYSEGGGTAYLGRRMIIGGRCYRGAGILPFDAELLPDAPPAPVARQLLHDCWLGPRGTVVRGYKSGRWRLIPGIEPFECPNCFGALSAEGDWFYHHHAVGSLLHLHLGALPEVVAAFAGPHRPSLRRPTARGLVERESERFRDYDEGLDAPEP
jgi:cobyrinic acid a,c-diamide synthase